MPSDKGHDYAEARLRELAATAVAEYAAAEEAAKERLSAHLEEFEEADKVKKRLVDAGELAEGEWKAWRADEMAKDYRLAQLIDDMARMYTTAAEVVTGNVAQALPGVAAENANWAAFMVSSGISRAMPWTMVDAGTVDVLLRDAGQYLPEPSVNVPLDQRWNRQKLKSAITQGVLLGDSVPAIADRVSTVTPMLRSSAVRLARTSVTAAENAGRVSTFDNARKLGIDVKKEWLAAMDGRTRSSHRHLDGVSVGVDEEFPNGCRYPGDPQGAYAETCNCRCTLVAAIDGVDTSDAERWSRLPEGTTYGEWKRGQKASGAVSGALNDTNDPDGKKRDEHARRYYAEVRKRDKEAEVEAVSEHSGLDKKTVEAAYKHIFVNKHSLYDGYKRFAPDYDMAQSWQRLRSGVDIQAHDKTMILHEKRESEYMESGLDYDSAHAKTCEDGYNYQKELIRWLKERGGGDGRI